jgi:hypothetical protein
MPWPGRRLPGSATSLAPPARLANSSCREQLFLRVAFVASTPTTVLGGRFSLVTSCRLAHIFRHFTQTACTRLLQTFDDRVAEDERYRVYELLSPPR